MRVSLRPVIGAALACVVATAGLAAAGAKTASRSVALPANPWPATPICGSAHGTRTPTPNGSLRLAQLNVLHGLTSEGDRPLDARLDLQVRELTAANVDAVGMEEVSEGGNHGRVIVRMAHGMAALTGS